MKKLLCVCVCVCVCVWGGGGGGVLWGGFGRTPFFENDVSEVPDFKVFPGEHIPLDYRAFATPKFDPHIPLDYRAFATPKFDPHSHLSPPPKKKKKKKIGTF